MGARAEVLLADPEVPVGRAGLEDLMALGRPEAPAGLEDSEVPEVLADLAGQEAQEGAPLAPPC